LIFTPTSQSGPARRMALGGAAVELTAAELLKRRLGMIAEPYEQGRPGLLMKTARAMTAASAAVSVLGARSRVLSAVAGTSYVAASVLTRFGVFEAGLVSAKDPKYTVVPQKQRLAARAEADGSEPGGGAGGAKVHQPS
jgi:hypothetical protein